ncbi:rhodanese-like domain-containing protein, partial [Pseudomonas tohonis]|uniref:rhodanese-like domain-containing protein n=1 Tax=Pseudomonas tohonis TaxID=2725477 RepID=UPI002006F998
ALPQVEAIAPQTLATWLEHGDTAVLDFTASANHVKRHIPGARWVLRAQLREALTAAHKAERYVLTCGSGLLARFAVDEVAALTGKPAFLLDGGNTAWADAGLPVEAGENGLLSPRIDRYRRPYEGTDNPREAMQAYLDWEFGLVEQLGQDGTSGFFVV